MPPGLIHEHQSPNVEARNQPPPQSPRSLIAFRGYLRLFLSGHPPGSRAMLRLIVASETSMPVSSKKGSQCSLRVRWGFVFSCFGSHSLKASPFTDGLPGIFIVWTSPVWRLLLSQRLMVERETPKRSWTSFSGYAALYCSERLQSEVPRISVHGGHSRAGSLLMQTAVRTPDPPGAERPCNPDTRTAERLRGEPRFVHRTRICPLVGWGRFRRAIQTPEVSA